MTAHNIRKHRCETLPHCLAAALLPGVPAARENRRGERHWFLPLLAMLLLGAAFASSVFAQPVVTGPTLITGPADPGLSVGGNDYVIAEYYGKDFGLLQVSNVFFVNGNARLVGASGPTTANVPNFGTSVDATNLAIISGNNMYHTYPGFDLFLPVTAGHSYKLQLILRDDYNNAAGKRMFSVYLGGVDAADYVDLVALGAGDANNADIVFTATFTSTDGSPFEVVMATYIDNPLLCALTLEDTTPGVWPPVISAPLSTTNFIGRNVSLPGRAAGSQPITYQWQAGAIGSGVYTNLANNGNISGATSNVLTLLNLTAANQADYVLVAANAGGSVTSAPPSRVTVLAAGPGCTYATYLMTNCNPVAYWRLNDSPSYQLVYDASQTKADAALVNQASGANLGVPGPRPSDGFAGFDAAHTALHLPGPTSVNVGATTTVPLNLNNYTTNNATMVAWIKPDGVQASAASIMFTRTDNNTGNLNNNGFAYNTYPQGDLDYEFGYCWNGFDYGVRSGLEVPHNIWSMVATVITPTNATVYICNATGVRSFTTVDYHKAGAGGGSAPTIAAVTWAGPTYIGYDPFNNGHGRVFYGSMAEEAVLPSALSADQILDLYAVGVGVSGFAPQMTKQPVGGSVGLGATKNLSTAASGNVPLVYQWQARAIGTGAFTNLADVLNYTGSQTNTLTITGFGPTNVAEYRLVVTNLVGSVTSSVAPLRLNQPVVDNSYQYAIFTNNPYAYWRMNEAPGSSVMSDTSPAGGFDASPLASTALGVPGPQPTDFPGFESTNTALQLGIHNNDGYASFPPLNLTAQQSITITAWIMPNGPQQAHTGLVCLKGTGDGSLNYSTFTDASGYPVLGYTWGGGNGNWNTGLQPPFGSWSFVALVITPTDATMYLFNPNLPNGLSTAYLLNNNAATDFLAPGAIGADTFYVNWSGWTGIFDGDMDEVAVFNKALSPSLVETLYGKAAGISKYPVVILQQPVSAPVVAGGNAQFKVSALGTGLAYQWQARAIGSGSYTNLIDGGNLWGSQTATLSITNATAANVAQYQVVITNDFPSSATSVPAKLLLVNPLPPALIGQWLNGGQDYADKSGFTPGGVHDGLVWGIGSPTFVADVPPGFSGSSLSLDGASAIMITNTATSDQDYRLTFDNNINRKFTVAFWARGFPPHGWYPLVTKSGDNSIGWAVRSSANGNAADQFPTFTIRGVNNDDAGNGAPMNINDGAWHHYAATWDGIAGVRRLYVDGEVEINLTLNQFGTLATANIDHLVLGAEEAANQTPRYFSGQLFDVRMYSYALSAPEIQALQGPQSSSGIGLSLASTRSVAVGQSESFTVSIPVSANVTVWVTNNAPNVAVVDGASGNPFPVTFVAGGPTFQIFTLDMVGPGQINLTAGEAAGGLTSATVAAQVTVPALIGQWVSGAADLTDKSGFMPAGTHDGNAAGATDHLAFSTDVPSGYSGQSLALDGTYLVAIANSSILDGGSYQPTFDDNIAGAFSVAFWAKGAPNTYGTWIGKRGEDLYGWKIRKHNTDPVPEFCMRSVAGPQDPFNSATRFDGVNGTVWHHYVATWDSLAGKRTLYVDGKFDCTVPNCFGPLAPARFDYLTIGGYDNNANSYVPVLNGNMFPCKMYDVRMYNYVVSGSQARALAHPTPSAITAFADTPAIELGRNGKVSFSIPASANASAAVTVWITNLTPAVVSIAGATGNVFSVSFPAGQTNYTCQPLTLTGLSDGQARIACGGSGLTSASVVVPVNGPHLIGRWFAGNHSLTEYSGFAPAGTHDGMVIGTAANLSFVNDAPAGFSGEALNLNNAANASSVAVLITNTCLNDTSYAPTFDDVIANNFTIAFWAKLNAAYAQNWVPWISKRGEDSYGFKVRRNGSANTEAFTLRGVLAGNEVTAGYTSGGVAYANHDDAGGSVTISTVGVWHHYAAVFDGYSGNRKFYVDGVPDSAINTANDFGPFMLAANHHLVIGAAENNQVPNANYAAVLDSNTGFNGRLYDVRIYNYALAGTQVQSLLTPAPAPALTVQAGSGGTIKVTWPASATGYVLQSSSSASGGWANSSLTVTTEAGQNVVTDTAGGGAQFYRLYLP